MRYLGVKWEVVKQVCAVKALAVGLAYCQLVLSTLKYMFFICIMNRTLLEIAFSGDENSASDTINCDCFIIVSVLEDDVGNPKIFQFSVRKSIKSFIFIQIVVICSVFISFQGQTKFQLNDVVYF